MYRPNRIGPWPCYDIEIPPWAVGTTLSGVIDNSTWPIILGGVRSVTVPTISNLETFSMLGKTLTPAQTSGVALGCLISGVNPDPANNILYSISGFFSFYLAAGLTSGSIFCVISKLDATPSDPDAAITLTDYAFLPLDHLSTMNVDDAHYASVNTQVVIGNFRGSTASQSDLPIFVGWGWRSALATGYAPHLHGTINVHKHLEDVQTQDPQR